MKGGKEGVDRDVRNWVKTWLEGRDEVVGSFRLGKRTEKKNRKKKNTINIKRKHCLFIDFSGSKNIIGVVSGKSLCFLEVRFVD